MQGSYNSQYCENIHGRCSLQGLQLQRESQTDTYGDDASTLVSGSNLEQMVHQIMEMRGGSWDKDTVTRALRAAYNNPERAVDYLYSLCPLTKCSDQPMCCQRAGYS